jgi:hypothetical protein
MRNAGKTAAFVLLTILATDVALAEEKCEGTLGVSRTIEVDATGGPCLARPKAIPNF